MAEQTELDILIRTIAQTQGATQAQTALRETQRASTGLNQSLQTSNTNMLQFGASLLGVSVGFAAVGAALKSTVGTALEVGVAFGRQIALVGAVSGATSQELAKLSDLARSVGRDLGVGATEGARGLAELTKGGVTTQQALGGALRATELLAKAGGVDLASAAEISAVALNSFGLNAAQLTKVADLVAGAANASSIGVEDFRQSLTQAGAVARTVGVTFDDTAVAIAELGQAGIRGSDAGTSLRQFLLSLTPTSAQASDALRQLGIITADGGNKFFDAQGKAKSFAEISQVLQQALAGYTNQQKLATLTTIFGSDAIRAASVFAREGSAGFDKLAASMANVKAADVAKQSINSLGGEIDILKGKSEEAAIQFEKLFEPSLIEGAKALATVLDQINRTTPTAPIVPERKSLVPQVTPGSEVQVPLRLPGSTAPAQRPIPGALEAITEQQRQDAARAAQVAAALTAAGQAARQGTFTLAGQTAATTAADEAASKFLTTYRLVNEQLRVTHTTVAQLTQDITELGARSGQLNTLQNALSPQDVRGQTAVAAQQALQAIDAQINAQKALQAIEQEIRREQEATKVTDPRDAAGADAARKRLDALGKILPAEQALLEAQAQQRDLQQTGIQLSAQEAALTLTILPQRQAIADIEQQINNLGHDRISLIQEQTRLLTQQAASGPQNALDDTQAQIKRDQLLLGVRGGDPEERRRARQEIRDLSRNVQPGQELAAFDATRNVTLADRAARAHDTQVQLQQNQLRQQEQGLQASIQPTEDAIKAVQNGAQQVQLLGQIAAALIASKEKTIQVIVQGAVELQGGGSGQSAAGPIADAVRAQVYNELLEAEKQIQLPPATQSSGVRRAA